MVLLFVLDLNNASSLLIGPSTDIDIDIDADYTADSQSSCAEYSSTGDKTRDTRTRKNNERRTRSSAKRPRADTINKRKRYC